MFSFTKIKNSDIQSGWTGSPRLWRAFNYGQESNIRCFVAKSVMSRVTRTMRGGSQKVTNDDEGEGGGSQYPPKMMMSFMKSHLCVVCVSHKCYTCFICVVCVSYMCYTCRPVNYRLLDRRAAGVVISHRSWRQSHRHRQQAQTTIHSHRHQVTDSRQCLLDTDNRHQRQVTDRRHRLQVTDTDNKHRRQDIENKHRQ